MIIKDNIKKHETLLNNRNFRTLTPASQGSNPCSPVVTPLNVVFFIAITHYILCLQKNPIQNIESGRNLGRKLIKNML